MILSDLSRSMRHRRPQKYPVSPENSDQADSIFLSLFGFHKGGKVQIMLYLHKHYPFLKYA